MLPVPSLSIKQKTLQVYITIVRELSNVSCADLDMFFEQLAADKKEQNSLHPPICNYLCVRKFGPSANPSFEFYPV